MKTKNLFEKVQSIGLNSVIAYLDSCPEKNVPKILDWLEKLDKEGHQKNIFLGIREIINDKENNWNKFINSFWTDIDDDVRKKIFSSFVVNATVLSTKKLKKSREKYKCNIPWAILMDPTSACNLKCKGCWAAEYGNKMNMSYETLDNIIVQGKELGIHMYIYSGGEPLVRKKDLIKLCEKHKDCMFLAFTNATLIDEEFTDEMLRVKNFVPAISIEGFKEETDSRRGEGTFDAVEKAMSILKRKKLLFGTSCCYTSKNTESIGSEEYFDYLISKGAKFAWFFTYIPVGKDAVPALIATPEQREFMYHQIRKFRETKGIFTMDFWNDGEFVRGCIAGGRNYLHINANGDIEPCAFIHYSDSNIYNKTLLEAFQSPLFMQYYHNQPFNENHLRPCPLFDNPNRLAEMVDKSKALSTEMLNPENVHDLTAKCIGPAAKWAPVAAELWKKSEPHKVYKPEH